MGIGQVLGLAPAENLTPTITPTPQVPAAVTPAAPVPETTVQPPQFFDYSKNLKSDVFGANLFTGAFARDGAAQFNQDYSINIGDNINVRFWGAFEYDAQLTVDPKGNIFIPHVGPLRVLGVQNKNLQTVVNSAVSKVFRANVFSYASLSAAQPVRVLVGGFVNRPGLYGGTSMDSLLHYLDQAGGIDTERGSFLNVQIKRGGQVRATVDLYEFLLDGRMPLTLLADGDVIFVPQRNNTVKVSGLAANANRFEFSDRSHTVADIARIAKPNASATHVRIVRNTGTTRNVEYYPIENADSISLENGDELEFTADKKPGTITVRVEGEHLSAQEYVLPYGSRMGKLLQQIQFTDISDTKSLQLFRNSIKDRQKAMLETALKRLEASVLTARSGTAEEAQLRTSESQLMMQWVERAKSIEPTGQVMIAKGDNISQLLLENGDIIRIPAIDNLVLVSGEVMFPNTMAIEADKDVEDYINVAGGYSQNADTSRIIIAHMDGSFEDTEESSGLFDDDLVIRPGDEILVLPQVDEKYRQIFKEVATMIYQIGLSARIATRF
ncbi:MAG: polysaccharide export protein [Methylococcaceae bacterium]|nr:polysaccharide export protein [Methylococcaceae bacterium]